ncbi:hypothetical protein HYU45_00600 [Candidatus Daviesbacteria bacterium]|nr:hypothetical protein [Candidatus Daviesbacteria bacterium]
MYQLVLLKELQEFRVIDLLLSVEHMMLFDAYISKEGTLPFTPNQPAFKQK